MNRHTMPADELLLHADFLHRLAEGLVRRDDADDLYQDTWVAALRKPPVRAGNLRGWLQVIAANLGRNRRREQARRRAREQAAASPATVPAVDEIVAREEVRRRVVATVLELPELLRDVVLLRFYEGLDSFEIGARLGRAPSTVRTQLQSALERLRVRLDQQHGERRAGWALPLSAWAHFGLAPLPLLAKAGWPVRTTIVALVLLAFCVVFVPMLLTQPPAGPLASPPLVTTAAPQRAPDAAQPSPEERRVVEVAAAAASIRGPEDLWGRVVRIATGEPVPDAEVQLLHSDADQFECLDPAYSRHVDTIATVRTDREGRFTFAVARGRLHRMRVAASGCAPLTVTNCTGGAEILVPVGVGATVEGVVREHGTGAPLASVPVTMGPGRTLTTAADGSFAFRDLPAGRGHSVQVPRWMNMASTARRFDLIAGQLLRIEIELSPGRTVHGVVTDAVTRAPLAGVEVSDSWTFQETVHTDVDGSYRLTGLDDRAEVHAQATGYARKLSNVPTGPDDVQLDITLARGGSICGRFLDSQGAPAPELYAAVGASFAVVSGVYHTDWVRLSIDPAARFQGDGLDPGRNYQLYVRGKGFGSRVYDLPRRIGPGNHLDLGDIVLLPGALLEGTVADAQGNVVPDVILTLQGCNADHDRLRIRAAPDPAAGPATPGQGASEVFQFTSRESRCASDGSFRFAGLAAGSYEILVTRPGHDWTVRSGPHEVKDGNVHEGIGIVVDTGLTIRGKLRAGDGTPLLSGHLSLLAYRAEPSSYAWASIEDDGSFVFEGLSPGDYVLSMLVQPQAEFALPPVHGVAAGSRDLDLVLQRPATITGRVADADGKPLRVNVTFWPGDQIGAFAANHATDAEGRFTLQVPPGCAGKVSASDPNNPFRQASAEYVAAGTRDLVLTLR